MRRAASPFKAHRDPDDTQVTGSKAEAASIRRMHPVKCPNCKIHDLVVITMNLGPERVVMRSCSACDLRSWEGLDGTLALDSVLDIVAAA